jgi:hypothetical protein
MIYCIEDQAFSASYDLLPPPIRKLELATHRKTEKERQLAEGK